MELATRLDEQAARHPAKPAFVFSSQPDRWETVSFQQLSEKAGRCARGLWACGLRPGMRAALLTPPSVDFFALTFALLRTGIVPVIVDPAIGLKQVGQCIAETRPEIYLGNPLTHALRMLLGWGKASVRFNLSIPQLLKAPLNTDPIPLPSADSPAAIIYTSGSTGAPKGVLFSHANFSAQLEMLVRTFGIRADEIDLPAFPLYALIDALLGVTSIIPDIHFPVPGKIDPARTLAAIQRFGVTNTFASPVVLDRLSAYGVPRDIKLPSLRRVITAGAPAPIPLQEQFRKLLVDATDLFGVYGATETLPIAVVESRDLFNGARPRSAQGAGVCLGRPVQGTRVRVIGIREEAIPHWDDGLILPAHQVGEITVQGGAVTREYVARAEANRLAKIQAADGIVHRMGDVGYFDGDGLLWYCGRKAQRVQTPHGTLFTEQIEGIFNLHPSVYRTALVGVDGVPVLWVELKPSARRADRERVKRELRQLGSAHPQAAMIQTFLFLQRFPTDVRHNSKIIRERLALLARRKMRR
ncbi:MAG: AMP-binding protein [Chloroflexi bacterium]|nr:AMP-binding protein [Chloroflexota bacterium]